MEYPKPVQRLFAAFDAAGHDLWLVGGAVRDWALGAPMDTLDDLDFCTDARPERTATILKRANFQVYELGAEFGTVGAVIYGEGAGYPKDVQVTTYRSEEFYRRGSRHPTVEFGDTIEQDLGRRDFSINSMALDARGDLFDPYGGRRDLDEGVLRVIGDPSETLAEDPLRILRIGRFMARLGFAPTDTLRRAAAERAPGILDISAERWLQEMTKLLRSPFVARALRFLHDVRILGIILPEVDSLKSFHASSAAPHPDLWNQTLQVVEQAPRSAPLRWAALLHAIGKRWTRQVDEDGQVRFDGYAARGAELTGAITERFRMDNATAKQVRFLVSQQEADPAAAYEPTWPDARVRRWALAKDPWIAGVIALARAQVTAEGPAMERTLASLDALKDRVASLEEARDLRPELPSGIGYALMEAFSLKPSPMIGELKEWLEDEIIEERVASRRDPIYYVEHVRAHWAGDLAELAQSTNRAME